VSDEIEQVRSMHDLFQLSDILEAIKACNFNKWVGPDCFDGNVLQVSETLGDKVGT
jgi:hypothetical protein